MAPKTIFLNFKLFAAFSKNAMLIVAPKTILINIKLCTVFTAKNIDCPTTYQYYGVKMYKSETFSLIEFGGVVLSAEQIK